MSFAVPASYPAFMALTTADEPVARPGRPAGKDFTMTTLKIVRSYSRYLLTALATVAFGLEAN
jgi:hypothetical protein